MSERKLNVGVIFGSRSVEHDVSVVSATQVMQALNRQKYNVLPIYVNREGQWFTGANLSTLRNFDIENIADLAGTQNTHLSPSTAHKGIITPPISGRLSKNQFQALDVIFPVMHGSHGEDGTMQGLFELVDLPYVGAGVMASAIANDKAMTKTILKAAGIPIISEYISFTRRAWASERAVLLERISAEVGFPAFVKPITLGSSIGIARVEDTEKAALHIDIALNLDTRVLVEKAAGGGEDGDIIEVNCAVIGNEKLRASTLEQPISYKDFLDFEDKYLQKGGAGMKAQERIVPAPLSETLTLEIQATACRAFEAINGRGTARLDFLVNQTTGTFWLNEINTIPGSLAFYLWEPDGLSATDICDELIQLALETHAEKRQTTFNYKSGLISLAAARGAKGGKIS